MKCTAAQDPTVFAGTLRFNLLPSLVPTPDNASRSPLPPSPPPPSDAELWAALADVGLARALKALWVNAKLEQEEAAARKAAGAVEAHTHDAAVTVVAHDSVVVDVASHQAAGGPPHASVAERRAALRARPDTDALDLELAVRGG